MPTVSGSLKSIAGGTLTANIGQLVFRLNAPNVGVTGFSKDFVLPTKEHPVTPEAADGAFSVNLNATDLLAYDAWYDVGIVWNESEGTFWDFGLRIKVPSAGGAFGELLFTGGGGPGGSGGNQLLVWVNENPPTNPLRGQWWLKPSTAQLYRWE